jgi:type III restriction enzyme
MEVIILASDADAMDNLEKLAEERFVDMYETNKRAIAYLSESQKAKYERSTNASAIPVAVPWAFPDNIDFTIAEDSKAYERHMRTFDDGSFKTSINPWEDGALREELDNGAACRLRNLDRKSWSLSIPYKVNGMITSMYPDLLIPVGLIPHSFAAAFLLVHCCVCSFLLAFLVIRT